MIHLLNPDVSFREISAIFYSSAKTQAWADRQLKAILTKQKFPQNS